MELPLGTDTWVTDVKRYEVRSVLAAVLVLCSSSAYSAAPCDSLRKRLGNDKLQAYALTSEKQLGVAHIDLLDAFKYRDWFMLYEETHVSDNVILLYYKDDFVFAWSGAARLGEDDKLEDEIRRNAPGIPSKLARCFSWYVTKGRSQ
jgi:hypothetical protein